MKDEQVPSASRLPLRIGRALLLWASLLGVFILAFVTLSRGRSEDDEDEASIDAAATGAATHTAGDAHAIGRVPIEGGIEPTSTRESAPPSSETTSVRPPTSAPSEAVEPGVGPSPASAAAAMGPSGIAPTTTDETPRGTLPREVIQSTVREAMPFLRFCFEWQLDLHPELQGRVSMEWRILEDGTVADANIAEDGLEDETVLRCFRGVIGRLEFPPPEGGEVMVRYPFILSNAPEARAPDGI